MHTGPKSQGPTERELRIINEKLDDYLKENEHLIEVQTDDKVREYVEQFSRQWIEYTKDQVVQKIRDRAEYQKYSAEHSRGKHLESVEFKREKHLKFQAKWAEYRSDLLNSKEHLVHLYKRRFTLQRLITLTML